jgi:orotate phosphoribosyltransferase
MNTLYICGMLNRDDLALKVAEFLLQIKAIQVKPNAPFTWASGLRSPIYCDNRKTLSHPNIRTFMRQEMTRLVETTWGIPDAVVGVATGGIAQGVLVAQELGVPFAYVRAEAKGHGLGNRIEGELSEGQRVIVVEDLISTGKSSLDAVAALRAVNIKVEGMVAIFTYGQRIAEENFSNAQVELSTLCDYPHLIEQAIKLGYVEADQQESLIQWRRDPKAWSDAIPVS